MAYSSSPSSYDTDPEKTALPTSEKDQEQPGALSDPSPPRAVETDQTHGEQDDSDSDEESSAGRSRTASIASRVLSRITTRSSVAPPPPPDGGFAAWMVGKC